MQSRLSVVVGQGMQESWGLECWLRWSQVCMLSVLVCFKWLMSLGSLGMGAQVAAGGNLPTYIRIHVHPCRKIRPRDGHGRVLGRSSLLLLSSCAWYLWGMQAGHMPCLLVATNIFNEIHSYIGGKVLPQPQLIKWLAGWLPLPPFLVRYLVTTPTFVSLLRQRGAHWCGHWQALLFWCFSFASSPPLYKMPSNGGHCHKITTFFIYDAHQWWTLSQDSPPPSRLTRAQNESECHLKIPRKHTLSTVIIWQ